MFITFEGIDGSGKTTQARLLVERLKQTGREVVLTREPGGSPGAEEIRKLLVNGPPNRWSSETELFLFCAARRDHLERTILPALTAGKWVICDRFTDSTRVYQGATRADLRRSVDLLHAEMIGKEPDLTILIDVEPELSFSRAMDRGEAEGRFEAFGIDMQRKLRAGFLALAEEYPERITVISGASRQEDVAARIWTAISPRLQAVRT